MMKVHCKRNRALEDIETVTVTCAVDDGDNAFLSCFEDHGFFLKVIEKDSQTKTSRAQIKVSAEDAYALGKLLVELYGNDDE